MDLSKIITDLTNAVNTAMDPMSNAEQRRAAYSVCDDFKNNSPNIIQCGLLLIVKENSNIVRHFGFQLIEDSIKNNWNTTMLAEKKFIKDSILQILEKGTQDLLNEEVHIKIILARIVVEIIKREWPQQWPNMLRELNEICLKGETQKELVLLIFLVLAETVHNNFTMPNQRKRDIYNALKCNLTELFGFLSTTLMHHYGKYSEIKNSQDQENIAKVHCQISGTVLKTFAAFLEWVPWEHVTNQDNLLLKIFCTLLRDLSLRLTAVECLTLVLCRKGTTENKRPLLELFSDDGIDSLFSVVSSISEHILEKDESNYLFLKLLCQALIELGLQLASIWVSVSGFEPPSTFEKYLSGMYEFTKHPSLVISHKTLPLWSYYFQQRCIFENVLVRQMLPEVVKVLGEKLMMFGTPSKSNSPACHFSQLDFDCDKDFSHYYTKYRSRTIVTLKTAAELEPQCVFELGANELLNLLKNIQNGPMGIDEQETLAIQLEGVGTYLDNVGRTLYMNNTIKDSKLKGREVITALLAIKIEDPIVLQPYLSCISTTFVFLDELPDLILPLLEKLFNTLLENKSDADISLPVKWIDVRRHACSCIFNVCKGSSKALLPAFTDMYNYIKSFNQLEHIGAFEQNLLTESLVLLSNDFQNYEKQCNFIKEITLTFEEKWPTLTKQMCNVESFIKLIGLNEASKPITLLDECATNRMTLVSSINIILTIVRRSRAPEDEDIALKGGFFSTDNSFIQSPAAVHVIPFLEGIFSFVKCINDLHNPAVTSLLHEDYNYLLDLPNNEKNCILGLDACPQGLEYYNVANTMMTQPKMRNLIHHVYESSLQLLGYVTQYFGNDFYSMANLTDILQQCIFASLEHLPDHKLKATLHYFLKPFIRSCSPSYYHIIVSIFKNFGPFMFQKLLLRWDNFKMKYGMSSGYEGEMTEITEVLDDQQNRMLTREYIDTICALLQAKWTPDTSDHPMDEETETKHQAKLSDLGIFALRSEELQIVIVTTLFNSLHWLDSITSFKSNLLCSLVFMQLYADERISSKAEVVFLLEHVICALKEVGEHELNRNSLISLASTIYCTMRPTISDLDTVVHDATGCSYEDIKKLDQLLKTTASDKKKRDCFRNLVTGIVGKHVGQKCKTDFKIKDLPYMAMPKKPNNQNCDEIDKQDLSLCKLFSPN